MSWVAPTVLTIVLVIGGCFRVTMFKAMREEREVARRERAAHPDPRYRKNVAKALGIEAALLAALGLSFYLGWLGGGLDGGVLSVVGVTVISVLLAVAWGVRAAVVSRNDRAHP